MRSLVTAVTFNILSLAAGLAMGQGAAEPAAPAKPKVYALVAAVGASFNVVRETFRTGSRLDYYRRGTIDAPGNVLNRIVLQSMDKEIALAQPDSKRVYLALSAPQMEGVAPSQRESVAFARVLAELEKMPQKAEWERIVVATPSYKAFEYKGVASKLQGLGISLHPLAGGMSDFSNNPFADTLHGDDIVTPEGKVSRSDVYLAPYSYLTIWIVDPKNLAVLDRQERFDNVKVADPLSDSLDLSRSVSKQALARQIVGLIERSIHEAIAHTELAGKVEVREVREVNPGETRK